MKKYTHSLFPLFLAALLYACGGGDDPTPPKPPTPDPDPTEITDPKTTNEWTYKYMKEWYLWPDEIGAIKTYDFTKEYKAFFTSLLTTKYQDGKPSGSGHRFYSYITREDVTGTRAPAIPENDMGFGVDLINPFIPSVTNPGSASTSIFFVVIYVTPGSQAETAGLKRGDLIKSVNGTTIDYDNYSTLYYSLLPESLTGTPLTGDRTLGLVTLKFKQLITTPGNYYGRKIYETPVDAGTKTISPEAKDEDPFMCDKVIDVNGKQVGYVMYNHFATGYPDFEDFSYDNKMKRIFKAFNDRGVSDVVIDLRYNGGGAVSSCMLMSSMLIPSGKMGTNFGKYKRNDKVTASYYSQYSQWQPFLTVNQVGNSSYYMNNAGSFGSETGVNLNKSRVYVIATGRSASASEMVINALRGADVTVYHIGTVTEGKNVGMDLISEDTNKGGLVKDSGIFTESGKKWKYSMRPITFYIYNAREQADYANGFTPDYALDEFFYVEEWKQFGDPEEVLLAAALKHIETGSFPSGTRAAAATVSAEREKYRLHVPRKNDGLINNLWGEEYLIRK